MCTCSFELILIMFCSRFLYKNLLLFFSKNPSLEEKSVFQQDQTTKLLSFKNHLTLHLYLSQLPKGAAQIPSQLYVSNAIKLLNIITMT